MVEIKEGPILFHKKLSHPRPETTVQRFCTHLFAIAVEFGKHAPFSPRFPVIFRLKFLKISVGLVTADQTEGKIRHVDHNFQLLVWVSCLADGGYTVKGARPVGLVYESLTIQMINFSQVDRWEWKQDWGKLDSEQSMKDSRLILEWFGVIIEWFGVIIEWFEVTIEWFEVIHKWFGVIHNRFKSDSWVIQITFQENQESLWKVPEFCYFACNWLSKKFFNYTSHMHLFTEHSNAVFTKQCERKIIVFK